MFEAQLLIAKDSAYEVYSPWFPRGGDRAIFTGEVVELNGAVLEVKAYTKKSNEEGNGSDVTSATTVTMNAVGRYSNTWNAEFDDLVRYKYEISGSEGGWILFRMLPPVWFDEVVA